jgi:hypothetical protein
LIDNSLNEGDGIGSYNKSDYEQTWIDYHEECTRYSS